jgi:DNA-binding transcriptional ArsR family regulator
VTSGTEVVDADDWMAFAMGVQHPIRVLILNTVTDAGLSPTRFSEANGIEGPHAAYHFRKLTACGMIAIRERIRKRGATELIYVLTPKGVRARERLAEPF